MPGFSAEARFDPKDLRRLETMLGPQVFGRELRAMLDETSAEMEVAAHHRAPIGETLVLSSSITRSVDARAVPLWAKVSADAANRDFRYGWALQNSAKEYHYLRGPFAGKRTKGWFTGALRGARGRLQQRLAALASQIEARWRS